MLVNYSGAEYILKILKKVMENTTISEDEFTDCFNENIFFFSFYMECFKISKTDIKQAIYKANIKGDISENKLINKLHEGFYIAGNKINELYLKIDLLKNINISTIENDVLLRLPKNTQVEFEIHFTIDGFNGGIQYKNGLGYSILKDIVDSDTFIPTIKHEMHHCGIEFWSLKDKFRQSILLQKSKISILILFLEDLLREGLAIFFLIGMIMIKIL